MLDTSDISHSPPGTTLSQKSNNEQIGSSIPTGTLMLRLTACHGHCCGELRFLRKSEFLPGDYLRLRSRQVLPATTAAWPIRRSARYVTLLIILGVIPSSTVAWHGVFGHLLMKNSRRLSYPTEQMMDALAG